MNIGVGQAGARVEARLGRTAQDSLEATVVLEAWGGLRPLTAMEMGAEVVEQTPAKAPRSPVGPVKLATASGFATGLALCAGLFATVAWMGPLSAALGPEAILRARGLLGLTLPLGLGAQWALRRRYQDGPDWRGRIRNDWRTFIACSLLLAAPTLLFGPGGVLAGILVLVWIAISVVVERGWGFAMAAVIATLGLVMRLVPSVWVDGAFMLVLAGGGLVLALRSSPPATRLPGRWGPVLASLLTGTGVGVFIVLEATGRMRTSSPFPLVVSVAPTVMAGLWAGHELGRIWEIADEPFDTSPPRGRSPSSRVALRVFFGSLARLAAGTGFAFVLLVVGTRGHSLAQIGGYILGALSIGLVAVLCILLDAVGRRAWSNAAVLAGCVPLAVDALDHHVYGAVPPAVMGAGICLVVALCPLSRFLRRPDQALSVAAL